jgi:hypothetical protein
MQKQRPMGENSKNRRASLTAWLATVAALYFGVVGAALAYVDPGTGSMLIQMLGAVVAGAIFYFRELRIRVIAFLSGNRKREAEQPPADDQ